ncbi:hypothetical protein ACJMK2_021140 [Sinanodonta woodiana]|uniref:Troponin T n=1 Tax=Sinanodonta woodiana TaxID=1069815 RepID=A0ABD3U437_SINWO
MSDTEGASHTEGSKEGGGYVPHKVEIPHGGDENEARRAMEEARKRKEQQAAEAIAEYEEARRAEKEKETNDIEQLRQKREQRRQGRVDDEKRLQGQRAQEDARRKAEEEERKRKKQEEEEKRKAERERKRQEAMKRMGPKKPNYVITKKEDGEEVEEEEPKKEVKSKEQMEQEKRAILAQRIHPLELDSLDSAKLQEKAKSLHEHIRNLVSQQYDLQQTFQRLQYDMIEMAERARQMAKSRRALASAQVDESFDRLADKYTGAPPKIQVKSKYERDMDQQTFADKLRAFKKAADAERGPPVIPDNGPDYSLMYI